MNGTVAQIESFIGYENVLHEAVQSAQKQANMWLAQNKMQLESISVASQTIAENAPGQNQMFYVHVITILYPRSTR